MTGRAIPEAIKRTVRKRCAFGCIICGLPIWDYHHIEQFAHVKEHEVENLVLLCPNHHGDLHGKRLSSSAIRKHASCPYNHRSHHTTSREWILVGQSCTIIIGGNTYECNFDNNRDRFCLLNVRGNEIFTVTYEDDHLLITAAFYDEKGMNVLAIERGEMVVSTSVWDFNVEGPEITIRNALRDITLQFSFVDNVITVAQGRIIYPPYTLDIRKDYYSVKSSIHPGWIRQSGGRHKQVRNGIGVT